MDTNTVATLLVTGALSVCGGAFGLAFARPRIYLRVYEFVSIVCGSFALFSCGLMAGGFIVRERVRRVAADHYGFDGSIGTGDPSESGDNTPHILNTIADNANLELTATAWSFGIAAFVLVVMYAGRALAQMELQEQSAGHAKPEQSATGTNPGNLSRDAEEL